MLGRTLKGLMVTVAVVLSLGATPAISARTPGEHTPHRARRAPAWDADDGCREIAPPARPLSTPPTPVAAATCS